ncbi:MAG TPA: 6-phospho-beta-glucosidase [Aggregatilineales bacterium]|nr:6-phospho-beta-glucosidase [Aggregatilineales bacterium]
MTELNITVIGGGSTYTPELIEGFIIHHATLPTRRLTLMDISSERLEIVGGLARRMVEGSGIEVVLTTDRDAAIAGADFVLTQFRVGGMAARANDERIPLKYGVIGQETTGPGGFMKALRTVPQALDIARTIERLAPNAFLINFTNPSGLVTEAVQRHSMIRAIGLCNVPINMLHEVAERLGVDPGRVTLDYVGLNHLSFARTVYLDGCDVTEQAIDGRDGEFDPSWLKAIKMVPNYYLKYYVHHNHAIEEVLRAEETRADYLKKVEADLLEMYRDPALRTKPALLNERGGARYSMAAVSLIRAIANNLKEVHIVNVRNGGSLPDLPEASVVEVPAVIDASGAIPLSMGSMPPQIRGLIQAVKAYEELTIQAALSGDRDTARLALMAHPLVPSWDTACALLDDLLAANRRYLPRFFQGEANPA